MKKLLAALVLTATPGMAAECSEMQMRVCVLHSPSLDRPLVLPCNFSQCYDGATRFDYFGYGPESHVRIDLTSEGALLMSAYIDPREYSQVGGQEIVYQALPVDPLGSFTYGGNERILFYTTPCPLGIESTCEGLGGGYTSEGLPYVD